MSSSVPAGTLTQLAGQGARLVASPRRRVFPGHPDQVRQARRFVARALDGCPAADDAVLGVSELASNAIQHTRSGKGGRFQVLVWRGQENWPRPDRRLVGVGPRLARCGGTRGQLGSPGPRPRGLTRPRRLVPPDLGQRPTGWELIRPKREDGLASVGSAPALIARLMRTWTAET